MAAARLLLSQMGIAPFDLVAGTSAPTFAEVVPKVRTTLTPGTLRTYDTHLSWLEKHWDDRRLDEISKLDLEQRAREVQAGARASRASWGRGSAVEHFVGAVRCVYRYAEDSGWIRRADNPARQVPKPARQPSHRYAIPPHRLAEICTADSDRRCGNGQGQQLTLQHPAGGVAEPGPHRPEQHQPPAGVVSGDEQGPEHLAAGVAGQPADHHHLGAPAQRELAPRLRPPGPVGAVDPLADHALDTVLGRDLQHPRNREVEVGRRQQNMAEFGRVTGEGWWVHCWGRPSRSRRSRRSR